MEICRFCGNKYKLHVAQCPTCGGREFRPESDALMTTGFHMVGYEPMYEVEWNAIGYGEANCRNYMLNLSDLKNYYVRQAR